MKTIHFKEFTGEARFAEYSNGRIAIQMIDEHENPIATCSINLPDEPMLEGEVAIKDYSENEGMLVALSDAEIIHPPHRWIQSGFVRVPICNLKMNKDERSS